MGKGLRGLLEDIEAEAQAEGPEAVRQLELLDNYYRLFAHFLEVRRDSKVSQAALSKASGVDQAEISRIERGQANPTITTLMRLVQAMDYEVQLVPRQHHSRPPRSSRGTLVTA